MNASRRRYLAMTASAAAPSAGAGCTSMLDGETDGGEDRDADLDAGEDDETDADSDASSTGVAADDWPSFQRTPSNDGYTPSSAPTDDPDERWSTTLSGALEVGTGDQLWRRSLEGEFATGPTVADGAVFVGTDGGHLAAFE